MGVSSSVQVVCDPALDTQLSDQQENKHGRGGPWDGVYISGGCLGDGVR